MNQTKFLFFRFFSGDKLEEYAGELGVTCFVFFKFMSMQVLYNILSLLILNYKKQENKKNTFCVWYGLSTASSFELLFSFFFSLLLCVTRQTHIGKFFKKLEFRN